MRNKVLSTVFLFLLLSLFLSYPKVYSFKNLSFAKSLNSAPQNYPVKKPRYDYMSTFLSRNTKPLGLKEDLALKKLLSQSSIKWSIRAGERHILN